MTSTIKGCMRLGRAPWTITVEVGFGAGKSIFLIILSVLERFCANVFSFLFFVEK